MYLPALFSMHRQPPSGWQCTSTGCTPSSSPASGHMTCRATALCTRQLIQRRARPSGSRAPLGRVAPGAAASRSQDSKGPRWQREAGAFCTQLSAPAHSDTAPAHRQTPALGFPELPERDWLASTASPGWLRGRAASGGMWHAWPERAFRGKGLYLSLGLAGCGGCGGCLLLQHKLAGLQLLLLHLASHCSTQEPDHGLAKQDGGFALKGCLESTLAWSPTHALFQRLLELTPCRTGSQCKTRSRMLSYETHA